MADAATDPAPAPTQSARLGVYRSNLWSVLVTVVVMGVAMLVANQLDLGAGTLLAGFTGIFFALGVGGGALRADLRKVSWYGPLTALSSSIPRIVAEYDHGLALALVCLIIFVAGLLPALGSNFAQSGLGLGIATLLGFALQTPTGTPGQTIGAAFVGVVVVIVLRIALKLRDPTDVTRQFAAAAFVDDDPRFGRAYAMWFRDKPVRWIGECMQAAVQYRTVEAILTPDEASHARARAAEVSAAIAARRPTVDVGQAVERPCGRHSKKATPQFEHAMQVLDHAARAAAQRNTSVARGAPATRRAVTLACLRSVLTWRSQVLRHAVRATLGVLLTFLVAWATVGTHDPLVVSMAIASFAILQISWTMSLEKARQRIVGVMVGAAVMAVALWLVPPQWLLLFALLAATSGVWFLRSNPVLSNGSFVAVSVGMNTATHHLNPLRTLVEYVLLLATAVGIGMLVGFVAVPHARADPVGRRVAQAGRAVVELLRRTAAFERPALKTETAHHHHVFPRAVTRALTRALTETGNLRSPLNRADELAGTDPVECGRLATKLETLTLIAVLESGEQVLPKEVVVEAADTLEQAGTLTGGSLPAESVPQPPTGTPDFVRLASSVGADCVELLPAGYQARLRSQ